MEDIAREYDKYIFSEHSATVTLRELRLDGYLLHPNHDIRHVLRDGDAISVVDEDTKFTQALQLLDYRNNWFGLSIVDFATGEKLWINCGWVKDQSPLKPGRIAISLGATSRMTDQIMTLSKQALTKQADGKKKLMEHKKDRAYIEMKAQHDDDELQIGICDQQRSTHPAIRRWEINVGATLSPGKEHKVQEERTEQEDLPPIVLPPPVRKGPSFADNDDKPPQNVEMAISEPSDSGLEITQIRGVLTEQPLSSISVSNELISGSVAPWHNRFSVAFHVVNTTDSPKSFKNIKCEFENKNKEWEKWDSAFLGAWNSKQDIFECESPVAFSLPPQGVNPVLAIQVDKVIHDRLFERQSSAHRSFPQPLRLRYIFEEVSGRVTQIIVTQNNPPLRLNTAEKWKQTCRNNEAQFLWFSSADDLNYETRLSCSGSLFPYAMTIQMNRTMISSDYDALMRLVYEATMESPEVPFPYGTETSKEAAAGVFIKTWILVDVENYRMKGFKVEIKTTTSYTLEYFPPPPFMLTSSKPILISSNEQRD